MSSPFPKSPILVLDSVVQHPKQVLLPEEKHFRVHLKQAYMKEKSILRSPTNNLTPISDNFAHSSKQSYIQYALKTGILFKNNEHLGSHNNNVQSERELNEEKEFYSPNQPTNLSFRRLNYKIEDEQMVTDENINDYQNNQNDLNNENIHDSDIEIDLRID